MVSVADIAREDELMHAVLKMESPTGVKFRLEVDFRPNVVNDRLRHSRERDDEDDDLEDEIDASTIRAAEIFKMTFASWDLTGPLKDGDGHQIVGHDEVIPLEVEFLRWVPGWIRGQALTKVNEIIFPTLRELSRSRRR